MLIFSRSIIRHYLNTATNVVAFSKVRRPAILLPIVGDVGSRMLECSVVFSYFPSYTKIGFKPLKTVETWFFRYEGYTTWAINSLNPELNPICYLLALLGVHHFLHVSRIRVKLLNFRRIMSYTYGAPILDVSRSHTTTQHSR